MSPPPTGIRLNKAIADSGYCARRKADALILAGRVQVNGETVATLGTKVIPTTDTITIDGQPLPQTEKIYLLLHKPVGFVSSRRAGKTQKTIYELISKVHHSVDPAGRLDQDSSGLLILSNDGDFLFQITHPRFHIPKRYEVTLDRPLQRKDQQALEAGVLLQPENKQAQMLDLTPLHNAPTNTPPAHQYALTLMTGYNRQIRRSFALLGYRVLTLKRVAFGSIQLDSMAEGHCRPLTPNEVQSLLNSAPPSTPPEQGQDRPQEKNRQTQHHRQQISQQQAQRQRQTKHRPTRNKKTPRS